MPLWKNVIGDDKRIFYVLVIRYSALAALKLVIENTTSSTSAVSLSSSESLGGSFSKSFASFLGWRSFNPLLR